MVLTGEVQSCSVKIGKGIGFFAFFVFGPVEELGIAARNVFGFTVSEIGCLQDEEMHAGGRVNGGTLFVLTPDGGTGSHCVEMVP